MTDNRHPAPKWLRGMFPDALKGPQRQAVASMLSGIVAQPAAGVAGLYGLMTGGVEKGVSNIRATEQALTYQPRDPSTLNKIANFVAPVTSRIEAGKQYLGESNYQATGSPAWATAAQVAPDALLALLGARGAGLKGPTGTQIAQRSVGPGMGSSRSQIGAIGAWHGSPHDFDQFDMTKLGTGEGNAAYGHGLYFSGARDVADGYRKNLSARSSHIAEAAASGDLTAMRASLKAERARVEKLQGPMRSQALGQLRFDEAELKRLEKLPPKSIAPNGRLYNVELAPDETDLLDWDAPLTPDLVRAVQEASPGYMSMGLPNASSGIRQADAYQHLADTLGPAEASKFLRGKGIPGIRYLDGQSRGLAGDGSRNYVMFDDKLVKIKGKE